MGEKLLAGNSKVVRRDLLPHHHPPGGEAPIGGVDPVGSAAPEMVRSRYARITRERERELGEIITNRRVEAQTLAAQVVAGADSDMEVREREALFKKTWTSIARGHGDFKAARNELAGGHIQLGRAVAYFFARRFERETAEDLTQAADVVLYEAAERYDPARPTDFSTFAYRSVRGGVLAELNANQAVHIPSGHFSEKKELIEIEDRLAQQLRRQPTVDEIFRAADGVVEVGRKVTPKVIEELLVSEATDRNVVLIELEDGTEDLLEDRDDISYDSQRGFFQGEDESLQRRIVREDELVDQNARSVEDTVIDRLEARDLVQAAGLLPRFEFILWASANGMSSMEISEALGVQYSYYRNLKSEAVQRIRSAAERGLPLKSQRGVEGNRMIDRVRRAVAAGTPPERQALADALGVDPQKVDVPLSQLREATERESSHKRAAERRRVIADTLLSGGTVDPGKLSSQYDVRKRSIFRDIEMAATEIVQAGRDPSLVPQRGSEDPYDSMDASAAEMEAARLRAAMAPSRARHNELMGEVERLLAEKAAAGKTDTAELDRQIAAAKAEARKVSRDPLHMARDKELKKVLGRQAELRADEVSRRQAEGQERISELAVATPAVSVPVEQESTGEPAQAIDVPEELVNGYLTEEQGTPPVTAVDIEPQKLHNPENGQPEGLAEVDD